MSDTSAPPANGKGGFSAFRLGLTLVIVLAVAAGAYFVLQAQILGTDDSAAKVRRAMGMGEPMVNRLGPDYTDDDGDLVADTPTDAADQLDPEALTFSFIASEEALDDVAVWQPFVAHLSELVGRPVTYVPYTSRLAQLRDLRDGKLHITGLNTGSVPAAVNACGFVPMAAPGKGDAALTYKMVVVVPAGSDKQALADLRGEQFAFTEPTSNSGCKAAVVMMEEAGLTLGSDYDAVFTHGHLALVQAVAEKKYPAGSTASDLLERAIEQGELEANSVEVIFESEPFPTAAIGITHKLNPELAAKLRSAMVGYAFAGTTLEAEYAANGADGLVATSYKDDFALIRRIDDAVGYDHQRVLEGADEEAETPADEG